jgi:uroporphyrinogen-III synthase
VTLTVLVTRPAPQAAEWVQQLGQRGVAARALPLLAIEAPSDRTALQKAWQLLPRHALAMFVSPNAVEAFFAARPTVSPWPATTRAGATGPGTARALRSAGVPGTQIVAPAEPPFDSGALWALLRHEDWSGRRALVVRGDGGRDEFAQALQDAGAAVDFVSAYRRTAPRWNADEQALARAALTAPTSHLWLLSSAEAIGHLATLLPGASWHASRALATHRRIAERARAAGFGRVLETSPTLDAVAAAAASLEGAA